EQLTGNIGDPYEAQPKDIDGYELVEVPSNETGEFGEEPQTVTYVYTPVVEPTPGAPVDVEYVDENGNPIADPEQLTGNIGDPYEAQPKDIDGYEL
ncbi:MucBP domain-containing protein, partial [Virgibacillus oceani]